MKIASRIFAALFSVMLAAGCSKAQSSEASSAKQAQRRVIEQKTAELEAQLEYMRALKDWRELRFVGMDNGEVPSFSIRSVSGKRFDSADLVGERPFVVFFFATWCRMCELQASALRNALDQLGPLTVIYVSADGPETWPLVNGYLREHRLGRQVVRGVDYPNFAISYNPFSTVPLVVVVGKNGGLVDYQMGYESDAESRLISAVKLARRIGPLIGSGQSQAPRVVPSQEQAAHF